MKINSVSSLNFRSGVSVLAAENRHNKYLYNVVLNVVKEHHIPAVFSNKGIDLSSVTEKVLSELKALGIIYKK